MNNNGEKIRIGILMGGDSKERAISLKTAEEIRKNLIQGEYSLMQIYIDKPEEVLTKCRNLDMVFIALHGGSGEDGRVQRYLDSMKIKYTGSGAESSYKCMNKLITKEILKREHIHTPKGARVLQTMGIDAIKMKIKDKGIEFPMILKPVSEGSSIGLSLVDNIESIKRVIDKNEHTEYMIEEYVRGEEVTVSLFDGRVLPPVSISGFKDVMSYEDKYILNDKRTRFIENGDSVYIDICEIAKRCWDIFDLKVYGRIDMIIKNETVYVLEINTLPGLTERSFFPQSAKAYGIEFQELLRQIIQVSFGIDRSC